MFHFRSRLAIAALALAAAARSDRVLAWEEGSEPPRVAYTIEPVPLADRTNLNVTLTLRGDASGRTPVKLPIDMFGTAGVHEAVSAFAVEGGAVLSVADQPARRVIVHEPEAELVIRYVVSWDPTDETRSAYRPSVGADHFHFFGSQWMVRPGNGADEPRRFEVAFEAVPEEWTVLSNFGPGDGPYVLESSYEKISGVIAGGDYAKSRGGHAARPIEVAVRGAFPGGPKAVGRLVLESVQEQRAFFEDDGDGFFVVALTDRPAQMAGVAIENAFVCLADPNRPREDLLKLIAHEVFHTWLPGKGKVVSGQGGGADFYRFEWFDEGFTEYAARRLLLESGKISQDQFVAMTNKDLFDLAENPERSSSFAMVAEAINNRKFMSTHKRLSYQRGALIALAWDTTIRARSDGACSVLDLIRETVEAAEARGGQLPAECFFEIAGRYGIDAEADWRRFILDGEAIKPPADAFAPEFALEEAGRRVYEPGFQVGASLTARRIMGLDPDGPAARAGLSDGMTLLEVETDRKADQPIRVVVEQDGQPTEKRYRPEGPVIRCPQYRRR